MGLDLNATDTADANGTVEQDGDEVDPRVGEYHHPTRGMMHTYVNPLALVDN